MATRISISLDTRRRKNNNCYPIVFKISHNRSQSTISSGYEVLENNFNVETKSIKRSTAKINKDQANRDLSKKYTRYVSVIDKLFESNKLQYMSVSELRSHLINDVFQGDFFEFANDYIDNVVKKDRSPNTYKTYVLAVTKLKNALNKEAIEINAIDPDLLKEIEKRWADSGVSVNTMNLYFSKLKHLLNMAIAKNLLKEERYPFKRYSYEINKYSFSREKTIKRAVEKDIIHLIENYNSKLKTRMFARDIFLFSFYTRGTNISNIIHLKKGDVQGGILSFRRRKTNKLLSIHLHPKAFDILRNYGFEEKANNDFLFPFKRKAKIKNKQEEHEDIDRLTKLVNDRLSAISMELGINKITTYTARHSWATIAYKSGVDIGTISTGLAHSDLKMTEIYIDSLVNEDKLTKADKLIFD